VSYNTNIEIGGYRNRCTTSINAIAPIRKLQIPKQVGLSLNMLRRREKNGQKCFGDKG